MIATLWASFKRYVIEYAKDRIRAFHAARSDVVGGRLMDRLARQIDRWSGEIFGLFSGLVDDEIIEQARKIKDYRDWAAHREGGAPPVMDPLTAYEALSGFIAAIRSIDKAAP